jgi:hypothetical protein
MPSVTSVSLFFNRIIPLDFSHTNGKFDKLPFPPRTIGERIKVFVFFFYILDCD